MSEYISRLNPRCTDCLQGTKLLKSKARVQCTLVQKVGRSRDPKLRAMKLLTHNMLACHIKNVKNNYPFLIEAIKVSEREADFDPEFLKHIFPRINWPAFLQGATTLSCREGLPETVSEEMLDEEGFLKAFHHALLEVIVEEGALICPETGRRFPISKGIPNLLLSEDEC